MNVKSIEEDIQVKEFRNESVKAVINILYTNNVIQTYSQKILKPFNLTSQQYNILRILKGQYPNAISIGSIKERVLDRNSDISRIIERLRKKQLVAREPNPEDRRLMDVLITSKGLNLLKMANDAITNLEDLPFKNSTKEELEELNKTLDKIRSLF